MDASPELGLPAGLPLFLQVQHKCAKCQAAEEEERPRPASLQHKCSCCGGGACHHDRANGVHRDAQAGIATASEPLPHGDRIQASFGRHDIGATRAAIGEPATEANKRMGSLAYTSGTRIGFANQPDVKLAAHEAAHVVQQRSGAKLPDGVGRAGDEYEQQADAAAEAVERGESAEPILDRGNHAGPTGAAPVVQQKLQADAVRTFEPPDSPDLGIPPAGGAKGEVAPGGKAAAKTGAAANKDTKADADQKENGSAPRRPKAGASSAAPAGGGQGNQSGAASAPAGGASSAPAASSQAANPQHGAPAAPSQSGAPGASPAAPQGGQGAPAPGGAAQAPAAPACNGPGVASCFTDDTPDPQDQEQGEPTDPPPAKSQEQISGDVPEVIEPDRCDTDQALAATPEGSAAVGSGPGGPAAAGSQNGADGAPPASAPGAVTGKASRAAGQAPAHAPGGGAGAPRAPAAEPEALASVGSTLESAVGSAEAQRNAAVAGYASSSAQLQASSERIALLRAGTKFAASPGESAENAARRADAAAKADVFFADTADRLDRAATFAAEAVPDRLGAQAEAAKPQLASSIQQQKGAISARIEAARKQARSQAAHTARQIGARAAGVARSAATETTTAIAALHTSHDIALGKVNQRETTTLDRVNQLYAQGRVKLEALGPKVGDECIARGEQFVGKYEKCKINRRDSIMKGHLTDRRAEAQQDAARETAKGTRKQLIDSARTRAHDITKAGRKDRRCAVIAAAKASRNTLDSQLAKLVQSLEAARDSAIASANQARDSQVASVYSALRSTLGQLSRQEHNQRQTADDTGYMQQLTQEQVAHSAAAGLQQNVVQAVNGAISGLQTVQSHLASGAPPDPDGLDQALSLAAPQVRSMIAGLQTGIESGTTLAESQLSGLVGQGFAALDGVTTGNDEITATASTGFSASMDRIRDGAATAFSGMQDGFAKQTQKSGKDGSAALAKAADGMAQACDRITSGVDTEIAQSGQDLEQGLRQNKQQMECEIPRQATAAAARVPPAWKKVLAVVLVILVIFIMIVATVVTFGAGGIVAGIIVGAIVGAVTSGMLYAASTLWNNQSWSWSAFGKAVAIGAVTGAVGGGLGAGLGGAVKGASVLSTALRLGVAVGVGAATDVLSQYLSHGFSFKNFSWFELGSTVLIAIVTFGIGSRFGGRYNLSYGPKGAGGKGFTFTRIGAPGAGAVAPHGGTTETPAGTPVADQPAATTAADQPAAAPAADQPAATPAADQPAVTPAADQPAAAPAADQPAATPAADQPAVTPAADQPAAAPAADQPAAAPAADQPAAAPAADQPAATPAADNQTATPAADQPAATPTADQPAATPAADQPAATPTDQPGATPTDQPGPAPKQPTTEPITPEPTAPERTPTKPPAERTPAEGPPKAAAEDTPPPKNADGTHDFTNRQGKQLARDANDRPYAGESTDEAAARAKAAQQEVNSRLPGLKPCFTAGTRVLTPAGTLPIEDLRRGALVLAADPQAPGSGLQACAVIELLSGTADRLCHLTIAGDVISATLNHPFYVVGRGWVPASALRQGDLLMSAEWETVLLHGVRQEQLPEPVPTFNLRVSDVPTYFVGISTPVLVHNEGNYDRTLWWVLDKKAGFRPTDVDGISLWKTENAADVVDLFKIRRGIEARGSKDPHTAFTPEELAKNGITVENTAGNGPMNGRLQHGSARPADAPPGDLSATDIQRTADGINGSTKAETATPKSMGC